MSFSMLEIRAQSRYKLFNGGMKESFRKVAEAGNTHVIEIMICESSCGELSAPISYAYIPVKNTDDNAAHVKDYAKRHMSSSQLAFHAGCYPVEKFCGWPEKPKSGLMKFLSDFFKP